jgi:peroxiredoxin
MTLLQPGDMFPTLTVLTEGGEDLQLPGSLAGHFGVVLFYRGSWCPYCNAQLSAFQRAQERLLGVDARVVALSVDDEVTTTALVAKLGLEFPVGHSADARAVAAATGAFVNDSPLYLQSTGFVLDPTGRSS